MYGLEKFNIIVILFIFLDIFEMIVIVLVVVWFFLIRYILLIVEVVFRVIIVVIFNVFFIFFIKVGVRCVRYFCFKLVRKSILLISFKEFFIFLFFFLMVREVFKMVMLIIVFVNWGLLINFLNFFVYFLFLLLVLVNCFCYLGINLFKDMEIEELVFLNFDKELDIGLLFIFVILLSLIRKFLFLFFNVVVCRCEKFILFFNLVVNIFFGILIKICLFLVINWKILDMKFSFWLVLIYLI